MDKAERKILEMVEQGALSAEEGLRLIKAMNSGIKDEKPWNDSKNFEARGNPSVDEQGIFEQPFSDHEQKRINHLKRVWIVPFSFGLLIITLGSIWMFSGYRRSGFGWGFWLSWIPLIFGIFLAAISFQTNRNVWLHVRLKKKGKRSPTCFLFSLPLPLKLTRWIISTWGDLIPGLEDLPLDELNDLLEKISPEEPLFLYVTDKNKERNFEILIG